MKEVDKGFDTPGGKALVDSRIYLGHEPFRPVSDAVRMCAPLTSVKQRLRTIQF